MKKATATTKVANSFRPVLPQPSVSARTEATRKQSSTAVMARMVR
jgi:hypothetical protein